MRNGIIRYLWNGHGQMAVDLEDCSLLFSLFLYCVLLHQFTHNICIIHFLHSAFYVTLTHVNKPSLLVKSFSLKMVLLKFNSLSCKLPQEPTSQTKASQHYSATLSSLTYVATSYLKMLHLFLQPLPSKVLTSSLWKTS